MAFAVCIIVAITCHCFGSHGTAGMWWLAGLISIVAYCEGRHDESRVH